MALVQVLGRDTSHRPFVSLTLAANSIEPTSLASVLRLYHND